MAQQTAVEWFFDKLKNHEIQAEHFELYEQAKQMEKEQMEAIREMLVQGASTNMSCASAIVEFDKLTKNK